MTTTISMLQDAIEHQKWHLQELERMRDKVQCQLELAIDLDGQLEPIVSGGSSEDQEKRNEDMLSLKESIDQAERQLADINMAIRTHEEELEKLEEQKKELEADNSG